MEYKNVDPDKNDTGCYSHSLKLEVHKLLKKYEKKISDLYNKALSQQLSIKELLTKEDNVEFLEEIKKRAKECSHADQACGLVYFINNTVKADTPWRNWHCEKHNYGGHGVISECPGCDKEKVNGKV